MKSHSGKLIVQESNINFYSWRLIADGFLHPGIKKYCGDFIRNAFMKIEKDNGVYGVDAKQWFDMSTETIKRIESGKLDIHQLFADHRRTSKTVLDLCDKITGKNLRQLKNKQFIDWFKQAWRIFLHLSELGFIPVISDFEHFSLTNRLIEILKNKKVESGEIPKYLSVLSSYSQPTIAGKETAELLNICLKLKTLDKIKKSSQFKKHVDKYCWLNYGYQGPLWIDKDFLERIKEFLKNKQPLYRQYTEHKNYLKDVKKEQLKLEKRFRFSSKEKKLFETARIFMFMKADRMEVRHRFFYVSDIIFEELSKRFFIPIVEFRYATRDEISRILEGKKVNHKKIISRRNLMFFVMDNGKPRFFQKDKMDEFLKRVLVKEEVQETKIINGYIAFSGHVRGRVKIINSREDMAKMEKGNVLVSIATMPDLLPAMMKAIAFITDQGGITSHAAIVAREMKKPCIIGTKIATKVLKDGDLVEVDADKGVVRILK